MSLLFHEGCDARRTRALRRCGCRHGPGSAVAQSSAVVRRRLNTRRRRNSRGRTRLGVARPNWQMRANHTATSVFRPCLTCCARSTQIPASSSAGTFQPVASIAAAVTPWQPCDQIAHPAFQSAEGQGLGFGFTTLRWAQSHCRGALHLVDIQTRCTRVDNMRPVGRHPPCESWRGTFGT